MLPREKFMQKGIDNLTDVDLISILIGSGVKGRNFEKISRTVVLKFRKILKVRDRVELPDLVNVDGVGKVVGMRILAGMELGRRLYGISSNMEHTVVRNSNQAYEILRDIGSLKKERVDAIYLNSRFEMLSRETVALGTLNCANLLPRDVIYPALLCNASFVVIAHNHPSGNCSPSSEDILLTKKLLEALDLIGLTLIDHLVISFNGWTSIEMDK